MTNSEKYAQELIQIALDGTQLALQKGKPTTCDKARCENCDLYEACAESWRVGTDSLTNAVHIWAEAEAES